MRALLKGIAHRAVLLLRSCLASLSKRNRYKISVKLFYLKASWKGSDRVYVWTARELRLAFKMPYWSSQLGCIEKDLELFHQRCFESTRFRGIMDKFQIYAFTL